MEHSADAQSSSHSAGSAEVRELQQPQQNMVPRPLFQNVRPAAPAAPSAVALNNFIKAPTMASPPPVHISRFIPLPPSLDLLFLRSLLPNLLQHATHASCHTLFLFVTSPCPQVSNGWAALSAGVSDI